MTLEEIRKLSDEDLSERLAEKLSRISNAVEICNVSMTKNYSYQQVGFKDGSAYHIHHFALNFSAIHLAEKIVIEQFGKNAYWNALAKAVNLETDLLDIATADARTRAEALLLCLLQ